MHVLNPVAAQILEECDGRVADEISQSLARTYPGGKAAFVKAMNRKARVLGMTNSRFADSAGLDARTVS